MAARDVLIKVLTKGDPKGAVKVGDALDTLRKKGKLTEDQFRALDRAADRFGKSALKITAAVVGVGAVGLKVFGDFESGMNEVRSLMSGMGDEDFAALKAGVAAVGKDLGSLEEATAAAYQAISAGVPPDSLIPFLQNASKDAIAGVTDIATAVDGVTSVLNAYQLPASEASRISDILFSTVKAGKTNFKELSASIFNVAPVASAAKIEFEEIGASLATLTKAGVPTTVATTQLRAAILSLLSPGDEMAAILEDAGYESGQAAVQALGFAGALDLVAKSADGDTQQLTKAFGSVEALGAVLGLTGKNAAEFEKQLTAAFNSAGASAKAYEENNKGLNKELRELKGSALAFAETLGNQLVPAMIPLIDTGTSMLDTFTGLPGPVKLVGVALAAMAAAVGPAVLALGTFARSAKALGITGPKAAAGIRAVGLAAKTAGPYLAALGAGYALGTFIDQTFEVSDSIARLAAELDLGAPLERSLSKLREQAREMDSLQDKEALRTKTIQFRAQAVKQVQAAIRDGEADIADQYETQIAGLDRLLASLDKVLEHNQARIATAQSAAAQENEVTQELTRQEKVKRLIAGLDKDGQATRAEIIAELARENALLNARISGDEAALKIAEDDIAIHRERQRLLSTGVVLEEEATRAATERIAKERQAGVEEKQRQDAAAEARKAAKLADSGKAVEDTQDQAEAKLRMQFRADELRAQGNASAADALERELKIRDEIKSVMAATGRSEAEAEGFVRRRAGLQEGIEAQRTGRGIRTITRPGEGGELTDAQRAQQLYSNLLTSAALNNAPSDQGAAPAGVASTGLTSVNPSADGGTATVPAGVPDVGPPIMAVEKSGFALVNSFNQLSESIISKLDELDRKAAALESRINDSRN